MSDCYLGLDQQFDIRLDVIQSSLEAQINSELEWMENALYSVILEIFYS